MLNSLKTLFFLLYTSALALFFLFCGWDGGNTLLGVLVVLVATSIASFFVQRAWRHLVAFSVSRQSPLEVALVLLLKEIHRRLYQTSLPLGTLLILSVLSMHGLLLILFVSLQLPLILFVSLQLLLILFVSLQLLYFWQVCVLTVVVKIGEQYPGVLTVVATGLIRLLQPQCTSVSSDAPTHSIAAPAGEAYQNLYGYQAIPGLYQEGAGLGAGTDSSSQFDQPQALYPQEMPPLKR